MLAEYMGIFAFYTDLFSFRSIYTYYQKNTCR